MDHALLIGIDYYEANDLCSNLAGSVADTEAMAAFLQKTFGSKCRIDRLLSPLPDRQQPTGALKAWPTYEAMVGAICHLRDRAEPGDDVLLHYSGHGGRAPTLLPNFKGSAGWDEGLVPFDIANPQARYLRDIELSYLIHTMLEKGLRVTVILDCCHSGGLHRGPRTLTPRGQRRADSTPRPQASLVAEHAELETHWQRAYGYRIKTRNGLAGKHHKSVWQLGEPGAIVLAACLSVQLAYEYPFKEGSRGLLTYCLLSLLASGGPSPPPSTLLVCLITRMHALVPTQTPVLTGTASSPFFGLVENEKTGGINVLEVAPSRDRVRLAGGQAFGLSQGARLELGTNVTDHPPPTAGLIVEIEKCGALESWARLLEESPKSDESYVLEGVRVGDRAVLVDPGEDSRRKIAYAEPSPTTVTPGAWYQRLLGIPAGLFRKWFRARAYARGEALWKSFAQRLAATPQGFVELASSSAGAEFLLSPQVTGNLELFSADGSLIPDVPSFSSEQPKTLADILAALDHLVRFQTVHNLENRDTRSHLQGKLTAELALLPPDYRFGDHLDNCKTNEDPGVLEVPEGRWVCLSVENHSQQPLQVYVLDLQPGWSIEEIFPQSGQETIEAGQTLALPFQIHLPSSLSQRLETLKVIATAEPTDLGGLTLPPLHQTHHRSHSLAAPPASPLETLIFQLMTGPRSRSAPLRPEYASRCWTSAQVSLLIEESN